MHKVPQILLAMMICSGQVHASHDGTIHPHPEHDNKQQAAQLQLVPDVRPSEDKPVKATTKSKAKKKTKPRQSD